MIMKRKLPTLTYIITSGHSQETNDQVVDATMELTDQAFHFGLVLPGAANCTTTPMERLRRCGICSAKPKLGGLHFL